MPLTRRRNGETGAMMVQMAVASIAFIALASLAVDYGLKLMARTEAQRAADAGALAGAVSLAFDPTAVDNDYAIARASARGYALANTVFGEAPDVHITNDIKFIDCPPPNGGPGTLCVQVDAYRNQQRNNALPTLFARVVGVNEQGVKATATAKVLNGDTTDCLRPWVVIDRWDEFDGTEPDYPGVDPDFCPDGPGCAGMPPSTYDTYSTGLGGQPPREPDYYVPPPSGGDTPGTGFRVPYDVGRRFALKVQPGDSPTSGWGRAVDLPRADTTNLGYDANGKSIVSCSGIPVSIADPDVACPVNWSDISGWDAAVYWAARGCLRTQTGGGVGQTRSSVEELVLRDPNAEWGTTDDGTPGVVNSCCSASPRIVPVAIMDIDKYISGYGTTGNGIVRIVNIIGFFVEGMGDYDDDTGEMYPNPNGKAVIGRLVKFAGSGSGKVILDDEASFSRIIVLVR